MVSFTCASIGDLLGKILRAAVLYPDRSAVVFVTKGEQTFFMHHIQDCSEFVQVEDIDGDLEDLVGSPITLAEEIQNPFDAPELDTKTYYDESYLWTFYKLGTAKGSLTIRWLGRSNGYYSEAVNFSEYLEDEEED